jgi:hypothetical protein
MLVETQMVTWREKDERKLSWVAPDKAAKRVAEADLAQLIQSLPDWLDGPAKAVSNSR